MHPPGYRVLAAVQPPSTNSRTLFDIPSMVAALQACRAVLAQGGTRAASIAVAATARAGRAVALGVSQPRIGVPAEEIAAASSAAARITRCGEAAPSQLSVSEQLARAQATPICEEDAGLVGNTGADQRMCVDGWRLRGQSRPASARLGVSRPGAVLEAAPQTREEAVQVDKAALAATRRRARTLLASWPLEVRDGRLV